MKRVIFIITILLLSLIGRTEQYYLLSTPLNGGQDYHYTANSHIILSDGFLADPHDGHEVVLEIDAYSVVPPGGGIVGGGVTIG